LPYILGKTNKGTGTQSSKEMKLSPHKDSEGYYTVLLDNEIYTKLQRVAYMGRGGGAGASENDCDETKLTIKEIKIVCEDLDKTQTEIKLKVLGTHKGNL
jgi:peptidyl-tRNA hydrolase